MIKMISTGLIWTVIGQFWCDSFGQSNGLRQLLAWLSDLLDSVTVFDSDSPPGL